MNQRQSIFFSILPRPVRRFLRQRHRALVFRLAIRRFLKDPEACTDPRSTVVDDLIYGWGNEGMSALHEYIACCTKHALTSSGQILECGSGLSTILVGGIAQKRGYTLWSLEHKPEWATKVKTHLRKYKIHSVVLCQSPLKDYGEFCWYDAPLDRMPGSFSLVICDGPPGSTYGGRYGLVPIMRERLKPGCVILLDDAGREQERSTAGRWATEISASFEILGRTKPYIEMTVMGY